MNKVVVWICPHCQGLIARAGSEAQPANAPQPRTQKKRKPTYGENQSESLHALNKAFHEYNRPVTAKEVARELRKEYPGEYNDLVSTHLSLAYLRHHSVNRRGKRGREYLYYPKYQKTGVVKYADGREEVVE